MGQAHRSLLFGGVIFAAGITGAPADKPLPFGQNPYDFVSYCRVAAYNWPNYSGYLSDFSLDLLNPLSHVFTTGYVNGFPVAVAGAEVSATAVSAYTTSLEDPYGFASYAIAYVEFTEPTEVRFEWDFPDFGLCSITPPLTIEPVGGAGLVFDSVGELVETHGPGIFALRCYSYTATDGTTGMARITLPSAPGCPCDLDANDTLNVDDVDLFVAAFLAGDLTADFDANGTLNVDDLDAFVACFLAGCP